MVFPKTKSSSQPKTNNLKKTQAPTKKRKVQPGPNFDHDSFESDITDNQTQSTPNNEVLSPENDDIKALVLKLATKIDAATNDIKEDLREIKSLVSSHGQRINDVEDRVEHVESAVTKLTQDNEDLRKEINKMNLIIDGIPDPVGEDDNALYGRVKTFICGIVKDDISFDTAFRLGQQKPNHRRPIKVRFLSMVQRNLVYSLRSNTSPPFYINEDLPFSIRRDHGLLRDRKRQEIRNGINPDHIKIDYKSRCITIENLTYQAKDGVLSKSSNTSTQQHAEPRPSSSRFLCPN
jgi:hypothetical protein